MRGKWLVSMMLKFGNIQHRNNLVFFNISLFQKTNEKKKTLIQNLNDCINTLNKIKFHRLFCNAEVEHVKCKLAFILLYILVTSHETHERLSEAFEADGRATDSPPIATATSSKAA